MGNGKGLHRATLCYHRIKEKGEGEGLPRATFCYHEIVKMGKGKGMIRASLNYNTFCINVGMEGAALSHLLLP